jgi:hypothetical protein
MKGIGLVVVGVIAFVTPARADSVDLDAIVARIDAGEASDVIAQLRPRLAALDATARGALGLAYAGPARKAAKPDRTRGLIYLASCGAGIPTPIAERADTIRARLIKAAERAGDTRVEIVAPERLAVDIDRLAGDVVVAPSTVWLAAGDYRFTAHLADGTRLVAERTITRRSSAIVLFEVPAARPPPPGPRQVDFSDGEPEAMVVGAPAKEKHPSLLPDRFANGLATNQAPLSWRDNTPTLRKARRALGFRVGGGIVDSSAGGATVAPSFAALARIVIDGSWLAGEVRIDLGPRGSDAATIWTVGVATQARWYPDEWGPLRGFSLAGGARAEVRTRDAIGAMPVDRFGVGATAALGWEPGRKRFAIELRGEQALTTLAGARPHLVLLELGFNL